jgi:hypothetical protein
MNRHSWFLFINRPGKWPLSVDSWGGLLASWRVLANPVDWGYECLLHPEESWKMHVEKS